MNGWIRKIEISFETIMMQVERYLGIQFRTHKFSKMEKTVTTFNIYGNESMVVDRHF